MSACEYLRPRSPEDTKTLMNVALGREIADLVIRDANVVNVYTGETLPAHTICVKGQWIAYVGPDEDGGFIGPATRVLDACGRTVIPGLIDGHTHIAGLYTISEFLKHVIPGGTTTIITETMETFSVAGYSGTADFLESLKDQPIKIFGLATPMVSISRSASGIGADTLQKLLKRDDVLGLGETYWQAVVQDPDSILPAFHQTLAAAKLLEGHTAGASGKKLAAYVAGGVSSCHEPINAEQVLSRLRQGLHVMVREGSIRRDLTEIAEIKDAGIDLRRVILATDGISPADLLERGYMEYVVQKAIDCGFDPVAAIQMATLNVAEHFRLDHLIGGIAPGKYADLVIIPDPSTIQAQVVVSNGTVVFEHGKLLKPPRRHEFSRKSRTTIHLPRDVTSADFLIAAPESRETVRVRVIEMVTDLVTAEKEMQVPVDHGRLSADPAADLVKIAAIDRTHSPGKTALGLVRSFGLKDGALACSAAWDSTDVVVVGTDEADMALAVNRIRFLQGGTVVTRAGAVLGELPLPVFGLISDLPLEDIARRLVQLKTVLKELGVMFPDPLLTLATLTGAAIPYLRICEEGLVNIKDGKARDLFVEP
jgi:adenine deaminase